MHAYVRVGKILCVYKHNAVVEDCEYDHCDIVLRNYVQTGRVRYCDPCSCHYCLSCSCSCCCCCCCCCCPFFAVAVRQLAMQSCLPIPFVAVCASSLQFVYVQLLGWDALERWEELALGVGLFCLRHTLNLLGF